MVGQEITALVDVETMPNIHGLHSLRSRESKDDDNDSHDDEDHNNDRYVGGIDSRGGGSGLAVVPNRDSSSPHSDAIFNLAEEDSGAGGGRGGGGRTGAEVRRTITMYRSGFTVDNGPFRRLDDPANSEFLTSMARGLIPRELREEAVRGRTADDGDVPEVMVGLIDRRGEEYDPERHGRNDSGGDGGGSGGFQSFSGEGQSLGTTGAVSSSTSSSERGGTIHPSNSSTPAPLDPAQPSTSIAIRLLNGTRLVIKVNLSAPVSELGHHIGTQAGLEPYVLTAGYPPRIIEDLSLSVEEAKLKGAQVVLKRA